MSTLDQSIINAVATEAVKWANEATYQMKKNLADTGKGKSLLSQSIAIEDTEITDTSVKLNWLLPDYSVFIDLGVRGVQNKSKTFGSYAFKNLFVGYKMLSSIEDWISRKGIKVRQGKEPLKNVLDRRKNIAFAIARSVKKKGIEGTLFYSSVFTEAHLQVLAQRIEKAIGKDFEVKITFSDV